MCSRMNGKRTVREWVRTNDASCSSLKERFAALFPAIPDLRDAGIHFLSVPLLPVPGAARDAEHTG